MNKSPTDSWAVVPHCERGEATGRGFVVRPFIKSTGKFEDQYNYGKAEAVKVFARQVDAQKYCDRLNG